MYLYKATCSDIPNPKQKGASRQGERGQGGVQAQGKVSRQSSTGARPCTPLMLWSGLRASSSSELKQLDEFLNAHLLSLHETVQSQTGMAYR